VAELGFVEELSAVLAAADVGICPLRNGSGTKLKVMDYLAAGLPVVTTTVGAAGIDLVDGESALIRDDDAAFAAAVETIVSSPYVAEQLSQAAVELSEQYQWEKLLDGYESIVERLLR
jgi:glycosyltransferase involved in cell wall biosynthesis